MKLIKPHIPVNPKLDSLDFIIMERDWFPDTIKLKDGTKIPNPKYNKLIKDDDSLLNPNSPNCILNVEETYIVWGLKELFDYIRRLGTSNDKYYLGDQRFYYNSAADAKYVYCNKAKFYFINPLDNIHLDGRVNRIFTGELDKVPVMKNYKFIDLTMVDEYFDYYGKLIDGGYAKWLGFDFETNKFPLHEDFFITGFSLSCDQLCTWFDFRYPLNASEELKKHAYASFEKFMDKYYNRLWAYNVSFEMTVLYQLFNKKYELQDSRALLVCHGYNWGSLKINAMKLLGVRGWTEGEATFRSCAQRMFDVFKTFDAFDIWMQGQDPDRKVDDLTLKNYSWLCEHGVDWNLFEKYWGYQWAVVPTKMLGYYCCLDAFHTIKFPDELFDKYIIAYPTYVNNARLGFELGLSGIRINKDTLDKTEKNMHALINSSMVWLDQFWFQNLIWEYERKVKEYDISDHFKLGVQRIGPAILCGPLGRHLIVSLSNCGLVDCDYSKILDYFDGDITLADKAESFLKPYNGVTTAKAFRQRGLILALSELLEEFYGVRKEIYKYNKRWNLTPAFKQVRARLNSYKESVSEAVFGANREFIKWDKYKELYEKSIKAELVNKEFIESCRDYLMVDNNIDAKAIIDAIRLNKEKVDFHLRVTIPNETDWDYSPDFFDKVAFALRTERSARAELNQYFVNFSDIVNLLHNRNELAKYDELEEIDVCDRPELVTYDGRMVPLMGLGGKVNYGSPIIKNRLTEFIYGNYEEEMRYLPIINGKWIDAVDDLPKPDREDWIREFEGKTQYFLKPTIEEHYKLRKENKAYKAASDMWTYHSKIKGYCTVIIPGLYKLGGYDPKHQIIKLKSYPEKWQHLIMLSHFYTYQGGLNKEISGYITGAGQGIRNRIVGVGRKQGTAEIRASKLEDIKYWSYIPSWMINEKASKRWASGFHTFVPHSDSMRIFEVDRTPGEEEVAIYFDINGAEIRSIAYTCEDPFASKIFEDGKDFYLEVVKSAYPDRDEAFWKSQRKAWKSAVLGIFYGIGDASISVNYDLTMEQVATIRSKLMDPLVTIPKVIQASRDYCAEHGEILTVLGDRTFADASRAHTTGFNMRIQGFSAVALADAFWNNVTCLNACGYPTSIKVVVHDSNTIVVKIRDLFKVIYGIEKYYKQYFQKIYHMTYKYDLVLHINLRDPVPFKYNLETKECALILEDSYGTYLFDTICKYYNVELIEHKIFPNNQRSVDCIMEDFDSKGHKYYCDADYHWPDKHLFRFKILNPIEELTERVNKVNFHEVFYKDRDANTHLQPTVVINE